MKIIYLKFTHLRVNETNVQDGSVTLEIGFNDGMDKQVLRTTVIDNPNALALLIVNEIKDMEKRIHYEFNSDDVLESIVNVVVEDEKLLIEQVSRFLKEVSARVNTLRYVKLANGYLDMLKELNRLRIDF